MFFLFTNHTCLRASPGPCNDEPAFFQIVSFERLWILDNTHWNHHIVCGSFPALKTYYLTVKVCILLATYGDLHSIYLLNHLEF